MVEGGARSEKADLSPQRASGWGWSRHCVSPLVCSCLLSSVTQCRFLCCSKDPLCFIQHLLERSLEGSFALQRMPFLRNGALGPGGQRLKEAPEVGEPGGWVQ